MSVEQTQTAEQTQEVNLPNNPFDEGSWVETSPVQQIAEVQETGSETATTTSANNIAETQEKSNTGFDQNAFIKESFGYESLDEAKADFEEFKKLKETSFKEPQFANQESKNLYEAWLDGKKDEVLDYLSNQKKIERLSTSEVTSSSAEEILKLSIKQKNKSLSEDEIDFVFNE